MTRPRMPRRGRTPPAQAPPPVTPSQDRVPARAGARARAGPVGTVAPGAASSARQATSWPAQAPPPAAPSQDRVPARAGARARAGPAGAAAPGAASSARRATSWPWRPRAPPRPRWTPAAPAARRGWRSPIVPNKASMISTSSAHSGRQGKSPFPWRSRERAACAPRAQLGIASRCSSSGPCRPASSNSTVPRPRCPARSGGTERLRGPSSSPTRKPVPQSRRLPTTATCNCRRHVR
mmetsp:Transcript_3831/g.14246  ORF Transcript_3831/g.14246 Transcript_3831/m.14246 type:complete len:237 (+) Transcript_3831:874-1584(+)